MRGIWGSDGVGLGIDVRDTSFRTMGRGKRVDILGRWFVSGKVPVNGVCVPT